MPPILRFIKRPPSSTAQRQQAELWGAATAGRRPCAPTRGWGEPLTLLTALDGVMPSTRQCLPVLLTPVKQDTQAKWPTSRREQCLKFSGVQNPNHHHYTEHCRR